MKNGAAIFNNTESEFIPTYKVNVIDTVAAGDSFNGALAVKIIEGKSLSQDSLLKN